MVSKGFLMSCLGSGGGHEGFASRSLSPRPHYPSMPKYPRRKSTVEVVGGEDLEATPEAAEEEEKRVALFSVVGMACAACAGSVEKAIKRLPGIHDAAVDVLNDRAQVIFYPAFVSEDTIRETIEDVGFEAELIQEEMKEKSVLTCRLRIKGMTCTSCSSTIESALQDVPGVHKALVALATEEAEVRYDPRVVSANQLMEAVEDTGFEAILVTTGEDINRIELKVDGPFSTRYISMVNNSLQALPGVDDVNIDPLLHKVAISYKPDQTGPRNFIEIIESTGSGQLKASIYPEVRGKGFHRHEEINQYYQCFLWSLVFTIPVFLTSMVFMYIPGIKEVLDKKIVNMLKVGEVLRWILSTPVQFIIGRRFYVGTYKALRHGSANMDVLIALGTNAAYFYSIYTVLRAATSPNFMGTDFFETSSMLISFILLGKYLEVLAKGKTSEAIAKLMNLAPETAILISYDNEGNVISEREIDSRLIQKNDIIKVMPGGKVASDGFVIWGQSHVNESMITGESRPVAKRKGEIVIGGTVNENGVLHIRATHVGSESALSQIVRLVESAQMAKAPVQKFADRISKYFVPLVILLSLVTWLIWFLAGKFRSYPKSWIPSSIDSFQLALQFGISVMVIACPCALGLATPTAVMVGTGVGASQGVLIKGGQALESAHKVNCIVFDKTGTLTTGNPVVVNTRLLKNMVLRDFYEYVAAAEVNSEHPLAKAIVQYAKKFSTDEENPVWPEAQDFIAITGHGVKARVGNKEVVVGNKSLMVEIGIHIPVEASEILTETERMAQTGIVVSIGREVTGIVAISDPLKPGAREVISLLKSMKVTSIMVTGDNWGTANAIAQEVGIDTVIAEAKPDQKAEKVKELQMGREGMGGGSIGSRAFLMSCLGGRPHYPSMPRYPKKLAGVLAEGGADLEARPEPEKQVALLAVLGMTCAGSVEKAIKRLPGINDAPLTFSTIGLRSSSTPPSFRKTQLEKPLKMLALRPHRSKRLQIKGMTCTSCTNTVESALQAVPGVRKALVALATEEAEIFYDPRFASANQLIEAVEDTGFEATLITTGEDRNRIQLKIDGTFYSRYISRVKSSLQALPGVDDINIDPVLHKVTVSYKPDQTGPRNFIEVIESTGSGHLKASIYQEAGGKELHKSDEIKQYYHSFLWSLVFTIPVFLTSMVFMYIPGIKHLLEKKVVNMFNIGELLRWILCTPVQFVLGQRFYIGSYKALQHGSANMDVLIALGTNAAYFYSLYSVLRTATSPNFMGTDFFETSSMFISFILLGKYLEILAKGKTSEAIAKLMNLTPETTILLSYGNEGNVVSEREIDSRLIQKNDIIKVVPGGKVASDGFVIWGQSHVNESMITGESRPVAKRKGDAVIGGTVNENGVLHVRVTHVGSESALSQIVIFLAFFTWLVWFLVGKFNSYPKSWIPSSMDSFQLALQFGVSVMVIACPCALGLATPTAVMVGTGVGASQGVLIKGGQALESAHKVNCVVIDKTGTLTTGKPVVVSTRLLKNMVLRDFYEYVAAAEVNSEHPLAKAIVQHAKNFSTDEENHVWPEARDFTAIAGYMVSKPRLLTKKLLWATRD
ncbi:copper-transporting ATPase [Musa troglodytarum]|uniref:P-type Cu(+) transporter n=1 Tax=Musa troglodytarum TaxID=320322 RepID=A0A9E7G1M2_9LILI|nr:copper-transporting ATPase [Musa troglodytarum]URE06389.1 copper-transporting ATPase [Musa troglodytarum]